MSSFGDFVYVALNRGTAGQWPTTFRFVYPESSGQADGTQEFGSQEAAKQFINGLLQRYEVRFSYAAQHALGCPRERATVSSRI